MYEMFERLIAERNITPYKVSRDTGVPQPTLSDWKNGKSVPKLDKLLKIANYFGVSVDYLMGLDKTIVRMETTAGLSPEYIKAIVSARDEGFSPEDIKLALSMLKIARSK